jgi:4-hydroxy-tetrahydrodipicolinate reductase
MGHEVEEILTSRGHEVVAIVDPVIDDAPEASPRTGRSLSAELIRDCEIAIEFSLPDAVVANASVYAEAGVGAVIGTTGWLDSLDEVESIFAASQTGAVYGSNFSIGAHLFFRLAEFATSLARDLDEYDLLIHELHHRGKKDSPSGTALSLAERVLAASPRKERIETGRLDRAPEPNELHVSSSRGGSIPGTHTLYLDSAADTIEVRHTARNRGGFALGAVRAGEWVADKQGLHGIDEFIADLLGS